MEATAVASSRLRGDGKEEKGKLLDICLARCHKSREKLVRKILPLSIQERFVMRRRIAVARFRART